MTPPTVQCHILVYFVPYYLFPVAAHKLLTWPVLRHYCYHNHDTIDIAAIIIMTWSRRNTVGYATCMAIICPYLTSLTTHHDFQDTKPELYTLDFPCNRFNYRKKKSSIMSMKSSSDSDSNKYNDTSDYCSTFQIASIFHEAQVD